MKWYLGIDVSKGYADFVLLSDLLEQQEETFQLDDTKAGHEHLKTWLETYFKRYPDLEIDCGLESTGGFENNWHALLIKLSSSLPLRASRLNPSVVKNSSRALLNANKTDAESAREIAGYLKRYADQVNYAIRDNHYASFRSLQNHIELVTKQKTQLINELKQLLYSSFPELQRFCKQGIPSWVLELLMLYPSPQNLARQKANKVARIKGITMDKAQSLIEKAQDTIASRTHLTDGFLISELASEVRQKQEKIKRLKKHLEDNCNGKEKEMLESIKGIGSYSAAAIMIQIEDVHRFASPKHLSSYFGLHPLIKMSGDKRMVSRMSKQGRPAIRSLLYMCANTAVRSDEHMRSIYARHRAKGKNHKQAIGAIMHKMIRVIWGILKHEKPYDSSIDLANQTKNIQDPVQDEQKETENKRRMQNFDNEAPISRVASKKRKVHVTSQAGNAELIRDLVHEPG
ncbi:MAG TPA: IS110 family transposase [Saprospiraceae bacterium]|nr:IS110 family transposase [Saprospiraceae bacterium]